MTRRRKWQSGSADLVSVAVGMVILSIAVTGTAASMIYGRDILTRQEHYKAVAYLLRGEMEKKQWELVSILEVTNFVARGATVNTVNLNLPTERGRGNQVTTVTLIQRPIELHLDANDDPDFYYLTIDARWTEPDLAGGRDENLQQRMLTFTTAVPVPM